MKGILQLALFFTFVTGSLLFGQAPTILITGGSGYIGSATTLYMVQQGYNVVVIDKKLPESSFFSDSVKVQDPSNVDSLVFPASSKPAMRAIFIQSDFADQDVLSRLFTCCRIDAVIHFAGFLEVGRSVKDPEAFYDNNVAKTITLLQMMRKFDVKKIIFSSSAAVYGLANAETIVETDTKLPINPYGKTKYIVDLMLEDCAKAYQFKAVSLRYFNASGALAAYDIGELHDPETHVIPLLLRAAYANKPFTIFGDDYNTPDKTCIRDYLHIYDLASAHYLALKALEKGDISYEAFNLGTGKGSSVKELVDCASKVTGLDIEVVITPRRAGDPDRLIADSTKARQQLGWEPTQSSLQHIIQTAHEFHVSKLPDTHLVKQRARQAQVGG